MCLGHESAGIIVQLGANLAAKASDVEKTAQSTTDGGRAKAQAVVGKPALMLGDKVALEPGTTCRMCDDCRGGHYNVRHTPPHHRETRTEKNRSANTWLLLLILRLMERCNGTTSCEPLVCQAVFPSIARLVLIVHLAHLTSSTSCPNPWSSSTAP